MLVAIRLRARVDVIFCLCVFGLKAYPSCHYNVLLCYKHIIILELNIRLALHFNRGDMHIFPCGCSVNYAQAPI